MSVGVGGTFSDLLNFDQTIEAVRRRPASASRESRRTICGYRESHGVIHFFKDFMFRSSSQTTQINRGGLIFHHLEILLQLE